MVKCNILANSTIADSMIIVIASPRVTKTGIHRIKTTRKQIVSTLVIKNEILITNKNAITHPCSKNNTLHQTVKKS